MENKKYIILEIIPTMSDPKYGVIAQLSALKLNGLVLDERFDYRLKEEKIQNQDILRILNYDKENFKYVNTSEEIMNQFKEFIEDYDLLIIDNSYTKKYLEKIKNKKESIFKYLHMRFSDNVIDRIIKKYQLEKSDHIVDLLYEALIFESNNKGSK